MSKEVHSHDVTDKQPAPPLGDQIHYSTLHALYTPHPLLFLLAVASFIWVLHMMLLSAGEVSPAQQPLLRFLDQQAWPRYLPLVLWWVVFTLYMEAVFLPFATLKRTAAAIGGGAWIANGTILLYAEALTTPMTWYSFLFAFISFWASLRVGRVQDISGADYEYIAKERRRRERRYAKADRAGGEDRTDTITEAERTKEPNA